MRSDDEGDQSRRRAPGPGADAPTDDDASDDLASLAGSLGSLPPDASAEADEVDLRALSALSGRSSALSGLPDDGGVLQLRGVTPAPRTPSAQPPPPAQRTASAAPAAARASAPDELSAADLAALPRRGAWVMPLLVGLGLGVGAAGLAFGLSARNQSAEPPVMPRPSPSAPAPAPPVAPVVPAGTVPPAAPSAPAPPPAADLAALGGAAPAPAPAPTADRMPPASSHAAASHVAHEPVRSAASPTPTEQPPVRVGSAPTAPAAPVLSLRPSGSEAPAASPVPGAPPAAPTGAPQAAAKHGSSVEDLLDQALASPERREAMRKEQQAVAEQDALPETPRREDVTKAMTTMLPAISGCAMGQSGLATATIVVRGDGRVASIEVAGAPFAGTASGRCMEGVIRRATFPRFRQPIFRIRYPLSIQ